MTYRPDSYVPPTPPPTRRGVSPWAALGLGCLALIILVGGVLGFAGYQFARTFNGPVDKEAILASLEPIPTYPKATFDPVMTKITRATGMGLKIALGGKDVTGAGFRIPAAPKDVLSWYDAQMTNLQYRVVRTRQNSVNEEQGQIQHQYFKKGEAVIVQVQPAPEDRTGKGTSGDASLALVIRIKGVVRTPTEAPAGGSGAPTP